MTKLIFAFMQAYGGDERESLLLARSLRTFGGELANHPLWLMMPQNLEQVSASTLQALEELGVQVHRFEVPEEALKFPYGCKVYAAAAAESHASSQADILIWMDSDTIFANEPSEVILGEDISLGYRPVMLKNISSLYAEPVNAFWDFIYERCVTPSNHIFPMLTTVDEVQIRPQFNAGMMGVRPEKKLLQTWRDNFERIYQQPELTPFYQEHILYRIFVHQSILAATLLTLLHEDEMQDLGLRVNIPMFLETEPDIARQAVTLRYDEFRFFEAPGWEKKVVLNESLKNWLQAQVG
jgi:hypothetical protein